MHLALTRLHRFLFERLRISAVQLCIDTSVNIGTVQCLSIESWIERQHLPSLSNRSLPGITNRMALCALQIDCPSDEICARTTVETGADITKTCRV
ncbi:hypothetical protein BN2476_320203 [Paraburkholderia piptadeniae]|uniref:Uncharacterized protein n=1 Tax=Paraburkholderia piptadeniae TaxID=1701573 RepID=A0A1N7S5B5_9BURK|nr:hypothetical protein BN2476_320203 [Paraburkholderia piptadeniae]